MNTLSTKVDEGIRELNSFTNWVLFDFEEVRSEKIGFAREVRLEGMTEGRLGHLKDNNLCKTVKKKGARE
ncbi:hypothetical protein LZY01_00750 [Levilactobacillus zymae]|uniref:Uncharacterized protein n=1 Tax=Levilactobacillus zymae TaxID=267363 RepID=A0ABQ0WTS2_9LACO|nr:hypothetical protein LZY01_00750 [Levilactobacillus zymae]